MAAHEDLVFDLYRLTIHDAEGLMEFMGKPVRSDEDIRRLLYSACSNEWDYLHETHTAIYQWGLRDFSVAEVDSRVGRVCALTLAKAVLEKDGAIFTPQGIELGTSRATPPAADFVKMFFDLDRHLVAVEYRSSVTHRSGWSRAFDEIIKRAAVNQGFSSTLELQAKPRKSEVLSTFLSFQRLTRIKVRLVIPNPELSRFTKSLYEELKEGSVREFLADMKNPNGLSQEEQTLPHAAAAMAEDGYKKGQVLMEGLRGGRKESIRTGTQPARGRVEGIKDFVRGQASTARTKEGQAIIEAILREIDRIADEPDIA